MPRPKIRSLSPDEVKISREGDTAIFTYADEENMGGGMNLKVGQEINTMKDTDLLNMHNDTAERMLAARQDYDNVAVEIPLGQPQIEYDPRFGQWSMKGDILRGCVTSDSERCGLPLIEVDDKKLTWEEFGRMLMTYEGWGLRLAVMPDDSIHEEPEIVFANSRDAYMREVQKKSSDS